MHRRHSSRDGNIITMIYTISVTNHKIISRIEKGTTMWDLRFYKQWIWISWSWMRIQVIWDTCHYTRREHIIQGLGSSIVCLLKQRTCPTIEINLNMPWKISSIFIHFILWMNILTVIGFQILTIVQLFFYVLKVLSW